MIADFFGVNIAYASIDSFINSVSREIIDPAIILLFALAAAYFFYGVFVFITNAENEEKRTEGKNQMLWGIIGFVIMVSVWFILDVVVDTFNINEVKPREGTVNLPEYTP